LNAFLASAVRLINSLVAVLIIGACAIAGLGSSIGGRPLIGTILGGLAGLILAVLINGALAVILEIERHLREIKESLRQGRH
jgi:hypothetical protein